MSRLAKLVLTLSLLGVSALAVPVTAAAAADRKTPPTLLVGELGYEGGPAPGGLHPTAGSVMVEFDSHPLVLLHKVGRSGQFKLRLSPGTYTVIGCGPAASGTSSSQCSQPQNLTLSSGQVDFVELVWAMVP